MDFFLLDECYGNSHEVRIVEGIKKNNLCEKNCYRRQSG